MDDREPHRRGIARLSAMIALPLLAAGLLSGCVTVPLVSAILKGDPGATTVIPTPAVDSLP